ncbi:chemotaxis protein CheW [Arcobacter sp. CECT 8989]|uniref:cache domain-containing protein n=1 Tax=Arcobacter sp. CECT 8989 TaxID=2044509 RepID=UPI00100A8FD3|nr:cache domain-containing protein [Arcobacter sp. CECT 8989]RXK03961.1 chemotaxis protein CheW [Arcobacter sp. CECT 8989]
MSKSLVDYKGIKVKKELYPIIKHIEDVDKYREELGRLSSSWDIFALLGQLGDIHIDIGKTKENFLNLTTTLLNHLSDETVKKATAEMKFKAQVAIDIVNRNLFERTADIGFLATDDDIRDFLQNFVSRYNSDSVELKEEIQKRFLEYVQKYSVYYDIVLADTKGKVVARLDDDVKVDWLDKEFTQKVINSSDEYVETFQYHDFIPHKKQSLVYSYKVTQTNDSDSEVLGVLCLCFRFRDEMEGIFNNLIETRNKEALTILDEDGIVIASSDKDYIPLESKLEIVLDEEYKIVSFCGRDYIAKTCVTNGYQGFKGLKWYGHIMVPLEYAFLSNQSNEAKADDAIIESMMENEQHFSKDLKDVFNKSKTIQENLGRVIWNGNVAQSKLNSSNREFSKSLLSEIGVTGVKANSSLSNLNQTIINSILKDSEFLSSLAIDIMDRNLYERANDCRWWALTSYFRKAFDDYNSLSYKEKEISSILKYINDLYTVYTNLLVFDKSGKIIAVSNEKENYLVGKVLPQKWVGETLNLKDTSKYCVSDFEETNLYANESTYVYCAAIRSFENQNEINGGIAIVFDSTPEFHAMLEDSLPKGKDGVFALFASRDKRVISSTNKDIEVNSIIDIEDKFFELKNGEQKSEIIEIDNKYYALGVRCSQGYREYKSAKDDYVNDVFCLVFNYIGEKHFDSLKYEQKSKFLNSNAKKVFTDSCVELATFHLGNKFLAVEAKNVIESISIDKLEESIDMDKNNPFKGMVLHKDNLISVLDIRSFIKEDITDTELNTIILLEYDKDNKEHCVGILVSSLESVSVVEKNSIQQIQSHFLGTGTLVESLADISDYEESQVAMVLDIKKIDDNLTKKV